eukprot:COSAG01_NODE_1025_length_12057_cov_4.494105_6_plen_84_part_00
MGNSFLPLLLLGGAQRMMMMKSQLLPDVVSVPVAYLEGAVVEGQGLLLIQCLSDSYCSSSGGHQKQGGWQGCQRARDSAECWQ